MRRQSLRIFLLISVMFAVAALVLAYRDVDLPGEGLDRGGSGPLGLVLGLDLRGGAHLVYEAERPVVINLTTEQPVAEAALNAALGSLDLGPFAATPYNREVFDLDVPALGQGEVDQFIQDLQGEIGTVSDFTSEVVDGSRMYVSLRDLPTEEQVSGLFTGLGYAGLTVSRVFPNIFTVDGAPEIDQAAEETLRAQLAALNPLDDLQVANFGDEGSQMVVFFTPLPDELAFQNALADLDYPDARVINVDGKNFTINFPRLDAEALAALEAGIREEVDVIDQVNTADSRSARLTVTLATGVETAAVNTALSDLGFAEGLVTESRGREYLVELSALPADRDLTLQAEMAERLGALAVFTLQREDPTTERMEGVVDTIKRRVDAFGITEPSVQRFGEDRVLVQLPGVEDTNIELTLKGTVALGSLESRLAELDQGDARVDLIEAVSIPGLFDIRASGATADTLGEFRAALEDAHGPADSFILDAESGSVQAAFQADVAQSDLNTTLDELEYEGAEAFPSPGVSFRIRAPTLSSGEVDRLREDLAATLPPIDSFVVSGGVEEAKTLIGQTAQLIFKERTCLNAGCTEFTEREAVGSSGESLTGDNLVSAFAGTHPTTGLPIVNFVFDGEGTRVFREMTTRIAGDRTRCIAHVLDGEDIICPVAQSPIISGAGFIEGRDFTFDKVQTLAIQLESGSLPISLDLVRESTVDSFLGGESLRASLLAAMVGLALIMVFMILYYRAPGVVAALALTVYIALTLAVFKMAPVTLTLSGLAALILSVGMAVDANILIFERLKEELAAGRSLLSSMEIGFRRAWPAIRDSNTSTFITCGILFFFGRELGEPRITGFAITLAIGVAASMFTALTVSRNFLQLLAFTGLGNRLGLFSPQGRRENPGRAVEGRQKWT